MVLCAKGHDKSNVGQSFAGDAVPFSIRLGHGSLAFDDSRHDERYDSDNVNDQ